MRLSFDMRPAIEGAMKKHPDLPIVIEYVVDEREEWKYTATKIRSYVSEVFDSIAWGYDGDETFEERGELKDYLCNFYFDVYETDEEFFAKVDEEMKKAEPYWHEVIVVEVRG